MDAIRNYDVRVPMEEHEHGMKSKVDELKVRGMDAVASMKRTMSTRSAEVRRTVAAKAAGVQQNMRGNPAKWAGIMTGAGIGLGLVGRYLRRRSRLRNMPRLVIIEAC